MFVSRFLRNEALAKHRSLFLYLIAIALGGMCGYLEFAQPLASFISDVFVKMFKCLSLPIIAFSLIVSLSQQSSDLQLKKVGRKTLFYTVTTTIIASSVASILYLLISPSNITSIPLVERESIAASKYSEYVMNIIPSNIFSPFLEHNVMGALLMGVVIGIAIRYMPDSSSRVSMNNFFKNIHEIFLIVVGWIIKILPIALFGFIATAVMQLKSGVNIKGLGGYLSVVVLANVVQGLVVLPIFLYFNKIRPFVSLKSMLPALSVAFFSKTSVGTLPITMETAENNLGISRRISRFVLPLCTAINMNGCAAFILTTVIYVMQNHGIDVNLATILQWILISTIAAIGNAGVPMGCFFLSLSLLVSMDVPIDLLWLILPFYGVIDMVETALNVWSDCCVAKIVDEKFREHSGSINK